ncbi:MAG: RNA polymerase sigma factor [Nitrospirae bacterium]|nr:RNA polymerase sigma factor [Nitrospirota bacterium]
MSHLEKGEQCILVEELDSDIIKRILNGDTDDFEIILKRYQAYVFSIVSKHLPPETVEEGAHEIFIRIYKALSSYRNESPLKYWISKIATRYCYDFWRERYRSKEIPMASLTEEHGQWLDAVVAEHSQQSFDNEEVLRESREVLAWALDRLTAEERMVITLLYMEELSVKETADLLGWTVVNVKVKAHRSRNKLRKLISGLLKQKEAQNETA